MKNLIILLALSIPFALQAEVDCEALYRDQSALAEPLECTGFVPTVKKMNAPGAKDAVTDVANFFEMRNNDSFGTHQMGDLSNQTVGNPALAETYYAMEYEETGTTLYAVDSSTGNMVTLNPVDGTATVIGATNPVAGHNISGLAFDGNGNCYASSTNISESTLYSCDRSTGALTVIGTQSTAAGVIDISASCDGTVYAHDIVSDSFYTLNTSDGSATLLGAHGLTANFAQGMTYDREAGELYAYIYTGGGTNTYARVNQTNGSITALNVDNPLGEFVGASQTSCAPPPPPPVIPTLGFYGLLALILTLGIFGKKFIKN